MDMARRSSRAARASQPLNSTSHHSSTSSNSSGRAERATRSNLKTESPRKSTPTGSLSSEPLDESVATPSEDTIQTRRKRARGDDRSKTQMIHIDALEGMDDTAEDDEAVRCICGFDDYPGPPQFSDDDKNGVKPGIEEPMITVADVTEDLAGFFVQCDICKVWQHGGCVGIMNEDTSPEEYFCEQCRKDLHKIFTALNGQRYSQYLPLQNISSQNTSRAGSFSKDGTRSPHHKNGRLSSSLQSAKRRSTMNSRDAAYDEEEQLRRAIEASKDEKSGESTDGGTRRGKRGRSDSEEKQEVSKRLRTASASPSPAQELHRFASLAESEDGIAGRNSTAKKPRIAAARNTREKEMKEERERLRQEAANKRKGRAERRRLDDSDPSDELPLATRASAAKAPETVSQPVDPPPSSQGATPDSLPSTTQSASNKKGGRPPNTRKGKLGKNQYTKDKAGGDDRSPQRSQSRDVSRDEGANITVNKPTNSEGKPSRARGGAGSKVTMSDMKKRVTGILDFISRTQLELAGEPMVTSSGEATEKLIRGLAAGLPMIQVNGNHDATSHSITGSGGQPSMQFKDLNCLEMMDALTRELVKWQKEFT